MVKLTFKNIGQGDSIILEWEDNKSNKIGIIDCNKHNKTNPVLNYLQSASYKFIDFVILSHPHYDHFSGLIELFNWCLHNKVKINSFLITSETTPDYIKTALKTATAKSDIAKVFRLARELRDKKDTQIYKIDDNPNTRKSIGNWVMSFISPSSWETDQYQRKIDAFSREEDFHNNPNGNWLSTLIKLQRSDKCVLLTSDIEKDTLTRIRRENRITEKIILAQAPHHGSKMNHNNIFWSLARRVPGSPLVISVGENKYGHPSDYVIKKFTGFQFLINRTDRKTSNSINRIGYQKIILPLDSISEVVESRSSISDGNDLVYML